MQNSVYRRARTLCERDGQRAARGVPGVVLVAEKSATTVPLIATMKKKHDIDNEGARLRIDIRAAELDAGAKGARARQQAHLQDSRVERLRTHRLQARRRRKPYFLEATSIPEIAQREEFALRSQGRRCRVSRTAAAHHQLGCASGVRNSSRTSAAARGREFFELQLRPHEHHAAIAPRKMASGATSRMYTSIAAICSSMSIMLRRRLAVDVNVYRAAADGIVVDRQRRREQPERRWIASVITSDGIPRRST